MTQFYGFNWQQAPQYSRLFNPQVMSQGQSAYNQGMGAFKAYDPADLQKLIDARNAKLATQSKPELAISANFMVGPDGRVYDTTQKDFIQAFGRNNPNLKDGSNTQNQLNYIIKNRGVGYLPNLGWKPLSGGV